MANTELIEYIKQQLAQNVSKETIYTNLRASEWSTDAINEAFATLGINVADVNIAHVTTSPSTETSAPTSTSTSIRYAGFWIRFIAAIADNLILIVPLIIIQFFLGSIFSMESNIGGAQFITPIMSLLLVWFYNALMVCYKGATLGKMLVGIRVMSENNENLTLGRAFIRESIGKAISAIILYIGFIMAAFTSKKQALHDKLIHSVVVYKDQTTTKPRSIVWVIVVVIAVVILAIISIFAVSYFVVSQSVSSARLKGDDAKIMSTVSLARMNAEIYFESHKSYSQAHDCNSGMFTDPSFTEFMTRIKNGTCFADTTSYAISAPLNDPTQSFCVDNSGYASKGVAVDNGSVASCQSVNAVQNSSY